MNITKLKRLVNQYQKYVEQYKNSKDYNEQDCRDEFISPMLECFGWDVHNQHGVVPYYKEVVVEKYSNAKERPDYTLRLNGVPKFFVEAKKPAIDIVNDSESARQARSYGWNANHKITILTNFENLLIYDATNKPAEGDNSKTSLYRCYNYNEYCKKFNEIYDLISRESVYSGRYDNFTKGEFQNDKRYSTEVDDVFLGQVNNWRLELGKYLYLKDDKYKSEEVLNDVVQEFINQIIFLRICEDRKLPLYRNLKETISEREELLETLTNLFKEIDRTYNSGLFSGENIIFDLNNKVVESIIMSLYYPQSPYLFNIIDPGILGRIYEDFLCQHLIICNGEVELATKSEYKDRSVVSTPVEVCKYMVRNTLGRAFNGKTPSEIKELKIVDLACGSGVFLEEAIQFIFDYCVEWYENNDKEHLVLLSNGKKKLPFSEKREIVENCIFGVDIDIHAVEVCRFSLLIKLIEDETEASVNEVSPILPDLEGNIKCGNALLNRDELGVDEIDNDLLRKINPFYYKDINNGDKFDIILGNPPYVKTEDIHTLESEIEFNAYIDNYVTAYKQFDKYFLFVEKAYHLLKEGGLLCYIIPNKFYKNEAGKELRKLIACAEKEIVDFGPLQLFPDKTIYSAIVTLCKNDLKELNYSKPESLAALLTGQIVNRRILDELDEQPWKLSTDDEFLKMIDGLKERCVPLGNVVDIFNGIQTSAERPPIYWFNKEDIVKEDKKYYYIKKFDKTYNIEKSITKPYFKPTKACEKGLTTYDILETNKRIIFPYDENGELLLKKKMIREYSGTYKYLCDCYDELVPKCLNNGVGRDIPNATKDTWYQYGRTQALTAFSNTPKLIVRVLSDTPMYAYDEDDMLIASGGTAGYVAIASRDNCQYNLFYIQAWLNHPYTERLLRIAGSDFEGGFVSRGTFQLKKLPFVKLDIKQKKNKIVHDTIVEMSQRIYTLNQNLKKRTDKKMVQVINAEKENLQKKIEDLVTKIYEGKIR